MTQDHLQQAANLLKIGRKYEAYQLIVTVIQQEPRNKIAWYGLSWCFDNSQDRRYCLNQVLDIDPNYAQAIRDLGRLGPPAIEPSSPKPTIAKNKQRASSLEATIYFLPADESEENDTPEEDEKEEVHYETHQAGQYALEMAEKMRKEWQAWKQGAEGEVKIGKILEQLTPNNFLVLHDITGNYGNIDHMVIGRAGSIFMIETKAHRGKIWTKGGELIINDHEPEKDFIGQTLRNSFFLRDHIATIIGEKPWVTPILVFTNAFVYYSKPIKGVHIINKKFLVETIEKNEKANNTNQMVWQKRTEIAKTLCK